MMPEVTIFRGPSERRGGVVPPAEEAGRTTGRTYGEFTSAAGDVLNGVVDITELQGLLIAPDANQWFKCASIQRKQNTCCTDGNPATAIRNQSVITSTGWEIPHRYRRRV